MLDEDPHHQPRKIYDYTLLRGLLQQARAEELRDEGKDVVFLESRL
jgi:hypothetical protein